MLAAPVLLMFLSACASAPSDCPVPSRISSEIQERAAQELEALPPGSAISTVLAASLDDRDKLRACRKIR